MARDESAENVKARSKRETRGIGPGKWVNLLTV